MAFAYKTVKLSKIYFDLDNPRHDPVGTEADAMQILLKGQDIRPLAKHIALAGRTSPIELMALVSHPKIKGGYITAEGNRRLCALKLLLDPDKSNSEVDKRYFQNLNKGTEAPISEVHAVVFTDMKTARPWVELRHKGAQDGRGTKAWGADEKTRFDQQGDANNPNARALALVSYAKTHALLADAELKEINLTTLTRYLSNRVFRHTLGITDAKFLQITAPVVEFERVLVRFLRDSLGDNPLVNSRSTAPQREAYAETLRKSGDAPDKRDLAPYQPRVEGSENAGGPAPAPTAEAIVQPAQSDQGEAPPGKEVPPTATPADTAVADDRAANGAPAQRDNMPSDNRKFVIKSSFAVHINDPALRRLYGELKKLEAAEFTFSSVFLLRAVVEKGTALYLKRKSIEPKPKLHEKLGQLATQLEAEGKTRFELKFLRTQSLNSKDDAYSADSIGHYIHGGAIPEKNFAFRYWDSMEPIMRHVLHDPK